MSLNTLRDRAGEINKANGFHEVPYNLGQKLMLVTTELSECLEAERHGKESDLEAFNTRMAEIMASVNTSIIPVGSERYEQVRIDTFKKLFKLHIKEGENAELVDAIIRILDIAYLKNADLDSLIELVLYNNSLRGYMHGGKKF